MDLKRIFRGWMLAILLVFVLLIVVLKFTGSSQYQKVDTSQVVKLIETGQVKSAIFTVPTQDMQVTTLKGQQLEASWAGTQVNQLTNKLQQQHNANDPRKLARKLVRAKQKHLRHVDQHNGDHEV